MSHELLHPEVYIAVDSAIGDAIGRGKRPHAMPNMFIDYIEHPQKLAKLQLFPESLSLNIPA